MVFLKTLLFFMYFKMQELRAVLPKVVNYIWEEWVRGIVLPVLFMVLVLFITGAVIFSVWYFISPATADAFVLYTAATSLEGEVGYLGSTYVVCIILGGAFWIGLMVVYAMYCIWKDHIWKQTVNLAKDNWQKATLRARRGATYDVS